MKNTQDVERRLKSEIEQADLRQRADIYLALYLYYCPTKPGSNGGFLFCESHPNNPDYQLADPRRYPRNATSEQIYSMYVNTVMRLPILEI